MIGSTSKGVMVELDRVKYSVIDIERTPLPHGVKRIERTEVRLLKGVTVPAWTQLFVSTKFDHNILTKSKKEKAFFIPSKTILNTPLRVGAGEISKSTKVLISNWGNEPITMRANALIGYATMNVLRSVSNKFTFSTFLVMS